MNRAIILTLLIATNASAGMWLCEDDQGRPVYTDRPTPDCLEITIDPAPVDGRPETYYGIIRIEEPKWTQ